MVETSVVLTPPTKPPRVGSDYSDPIKDLGDKIASLTIKEAKELSDYIEWILGRT